MPTASVDMALAAAMPATDVELEVAVASVTAVVVPSMPVTSVTLSTAAVLMVSGIGGKKSIPSNDRLLFLL